MNTVTGHCSCDVHKPWGYADTVSRETETLMQNLNITRGKLLNK